MNNMLFIGNHGTNKINISSILKHGFVPSSGEGHWYGRGVYFFIDGINCTSIDKLAEQWAKDQSYNKKTKNREHLYMSRVNIYLSLYRRNGNKAFYI